MQAIDAVGPEYETAKRAINRTAGYEDGYGIGLMTKFRTGRPVARRRNQGS
jgi:hypothetical protein